MKRTIDVVASAPEKSGINATGIILLVALLVVLAAALLAWQASKSRRAREAS